MLCLAGRSEPGPGIEALEGLITYAIGRLNADAYSWPAVTSQAPRIFEIGGIPLLGARLMLRVPVSIELEVASMAIPTPLILDDAGLKIGDGATPSEALRELACVTNHLELSPDVAVTTLDTMCGSVDYPGNVKWSLVATLYQSFDPDATEEVLSEAVASGGPVGFEIVGRKGDPVSATNPMWSGEAIPQPYAPINGDAGEASTVELEWSVMGEPTKSIVPATARAASASKS